MGSMPSRTDPTGSDDAGPSLACILHPTRGVTTDSTTQLSFKSRAREQILRLNRELKAERERHERVIKEMREQNKEDVVSLSSRVEYFEAQWSRLQRRMSELWLEVEGLKRPGHTYTPKSDASTQTPNNSIKNRSTQTRENAHSNLGVKLATAPEDELKQWRTAFNHLSGTPEHIALGCKLTSLELKDWQTAFEQIPGTPAQKAASSKEAIDELKKWRTSFNHVLGTPMQRAEASKSFLRKFSLEQSKSSGLLQMTNTLQEQVQNLEGKIKGHEYDKARLKSDIRGLQEQNLSLSTELRREMSKRKKLLRAVEEYQGTSNPQIDYERLASTIGPGSSRCGSDIDNQPKSPKSVQLPKRKREVSEPDRQQDEPLPASQRRRIEYSDSGRGQREGQGTIMAQGAAPQNLLGRQDSLVSSTTRSIPPIGAPMGSSGGTIYSIPTAPRSMLVQCPPSYPMGPNGVAEGPLRNSGNIEPLDAGSSSTASKIDSSCKNTDMPKTSLAVEKKWKHSMLKKGN